MHIRSKTSHESVHCWVPYRATQKLLNLDCSKTRSDLEYSSPAFDKYARCKKSKSIKLRPTRVFRLYLSYLVSLQDTCLLKAGLKHSRSFSKYVVLFSEYSSKMPKAEEPSQICYVHCKLEQK